MWRKLEIHLTHILVWEISFYIFMSTTAWNILSINFSICLVNASNSIEIFVSQVTLAPQRDPDWTWTEADNSRKAPRSSEIARSRIVRRRGGVMDRVSLASSTTIGIIGTTARYRWRSAPTLSSRLWKVVGRAAGARNGKNRRMPAACYLKIRASSRILASSPIMPPITLPSTAEVPRPLRVRRGIASIVQVSDILLINQLIYAKFVRDFF